MNVSAIEADEIEKFPWAFWVGPDVDDGKLYVTSYLFLR